METSVDVVTVDALAALSARTLTGATLVPIAGTGSAEVGAAGLALVEGADLLAADHAGLTALVVRAALLAIHDARLSFLGFLAGRGVRVGEVCVLGPVDLQARARIVTVDAPVPDTTPALLGAALSRPRGTRSSELGTTGLLAVLAGTRLPGQAALVAGRAVLVDCFARRSPGRL